MQIRDRVSELRDAALFGSGRVSVDENDLQSIHSVLVSSSELQDDLEGKIEELQSEVKDMAADIDKAEQSVNAAIKTVELSKMPGHVRSAVLQVLQHAGHGIDGLRKNDIQDVSERIASSLFASGINV